VINQVALAGGQPPSHNDFFKNLSITQPYDAHNTRHFFRALTTLVAVRGTGDDGLALLLGKEFAQSKVKTWTETIKITESESLHRGY
jgi:hypothetical protein